MRPQQQNRRMRGRNGGGNNNNNNNNRKGPNPLTRNYESNGPDVKIRGSAQQIAEKYAQLARDAQSSGDRVMAENYLQHAEHYNRIIAAAQAQMPIQNFQQNRDASDEDDDERDDMENSGQGNFQNNQGQNPGGQGEQPQPQQFGSGSEQGSGPQPDIEGMPAEVALNPEASGEGNAAPRERQSSERQANGDNREGARRSRRPRRGERNRSDAGDAGSDDNGGDDAGAGGLAATLSRGAGAVPLKEAAPEPQTGGDAALADAES